MLNIATHVDENKPLVRDYFFGQNYPNPFNSTTKVSYNVLSGTRLKISIFDILGREIKILKDEFTLPGRHTIEWDGTNSFGLHVGSGICFCRIKTEFSDTMFKMLMIK